MKKIDLSVIIINYKTPQLTLDCLKTLLRSRTDFSLEVIVLDNNSKDNSRSLIRRHFPEVIFIQSAQNLGFAGGNNRAVQRARGEYLLFLNSDTQVFPDTLQKSLARLQQSNRIGVLGCMLLNPDQTVQRSIFRFPGVSLFLAELFFLPNLAIYDDYRYFKYDRERLVDFVSGAFLLMPAKIFRQVGGFEERYFMYAEETELCLKVKQLGYQALFFPKARIIHLGGSSTSDKTEINKRIVQSKVRYLKKNSKWFHAALAILIISNLLRMLLVFKNSARKNYFNLVKIYAGAFWGC